MDYCNGDAVQPRTSTAKVSVPDGFDLESFMKLGVAKERLGVVDPAEWTNTFRLLTTVKDDVEQDTGDDSVVIVLQDSSDQLLDTVLVVSGKGEWLWE